MSRRALKGLQVTRLLRRLAVFLPPYREPKFWATQALIGVVAVVHSALEALGLLDFLGSASVIETSLFFIPLTYAALSYGVSGAAATALWATLLTVPNWILAHQGIERAAVVTQMLIVDAVSVFVASRVDAQKRAQADAEAAWRALQISELKYRGLFETAGEAILVYDTNRNVVECNAAACALFELPAGAMGEQLSGAVLPQEVATALIRAAETPSPKPEQVLLRRSEGGEVWVQLLCTSYSDEDGLVQVVLQDVSEQRLREAGLETYAAQMLLAQEAERKRIAQELHDETIHALLLLCRKLDDSQVRSSSGSAPVAEMLQEAHADAESIVGSVRSFARGLRPPTLDDLGLSPAIDRLVTELSMRSAIRGEFVVSGEGRRLSADAELGLFRIAQEALHNVERHSGASRVTVSLSLSPDKAELVVDDDGNGFSVPKRLDDLANQQRLGILGMQERARMLGGKFMVRSEPGSGTSIAAEIPVSSVGD